jgi:hypothetical protein
MKLAYLTEPRTAAHNPRMGRTPWWAGAMVVLGSSLAAACVTVKAPDKPIVIELNINIKQEVVYRLAADAGNTIESNKDIF